MIITDISPAFCVRGTAIKYLEKFISMHLSSDLYVRIASKVGFLKEIKSTTWYPVSHFIRMQEVCSEKIEMDLEDLVLYSSELTLKEDLKKYYQLLIRLAGVHLVIKQMPLVAKIYTNFVTLKVLENRKNFIAAYSELPSQLTDWYTVASEGAISGILQVCGQKLKSFQVVKKEDYIKEDQSWSRWYYEMTY